MAGTAELDSANAAQVTQLAKAVLDPDDPTGRDLPLPLLELLNIFTDSFTASHAVETKELVVRALRSSLARTRSGHDQVLQTVTPLLLEPALSLRLQAAGCLLQYTSTATLATLSLHLRLLVTTITRSLAPLQLANPLAPSLSTLRFVSLLLRILNALFTKVSPLPPEVVSLTATLLSSWVYYRTGGPGVGLAPERGRVTAATGGGGFGGGAMGAFMPGPFTSPKKGGSRSLSRSSSRSSLTGWSSESEEEEGQVEKRQGSVQVRLDALACLRALASNDPRALHKQWSLFLADSPYLRSQTTLITLIESDVSVAVRVRACTALNTMLEGSAPYLAIAEDRPTKASFTSLSSKIGGIVSELHLKLASLLTSSTSATQPELSGALLKVAATLAENAPYGRMQKPLAQPLATSLVPLIHSRDSSVATVALSALSKLALNVYAQPPSATKAQSLDALSLAGGSLEVLKSRESSPEVLVNAWTLLGVAAPRAGSLDLAPALQALHANFATASLPLQEAQVAFIASLFRPITPDPTYSGSPVERISLQPYASSLVAVVRSALVSPRASLRVLGCGVLSSPVLAVLELSTSNVDPFEEALRLSDLDLEADSGVRTAATRTLGLLIKGELLQQRTQVFKRVVEALVARCDDEDAVRASACWSLANCCDLLTPSNVLALEVTPLLTVALGLAMSSDGEKIQTNGLRCLGSLLKVTQIDAIPSDILPLIVDTLLVSLSSPNTPKIRWNAATSISNALASTVLPLATREKLLNGLSESLTSCPNFKVRIQATVGLMVSPRRTEYATVFDLVLNRVHEAKERAVNEEKELGRSKEGAHVRALAVKLDACLEHLMMLK